MPNERKLERRRLIAEQKQKLVLDSLAREIHYGRLTRQRNYKNWKQLLSNITRDQQKNLVEYTHHIFELAVDVKDFTISYLMDELESINEHHLMNLKNHDYRIKRLIQSLHEDIGEIYDDYMGKVQSMIEHKKEHYKEFRNKMRDEENYFRSIIYKMNMNEAEFAKMLSTNLFCEVEHFLDSSMHLDVLEARYGLKIQRSWAKFVKFLEGYFKEAALYEREMRGSYQHHLESEKTKRKQLRKLSHLTKVVRRLEAKLRHVKKTEGGELQMNLDIKEKLHRNLKILRGKLYKQANSDAQKTRTVVVRSQEILDYLAKILRRGENLIGMLSVVKKLETYNEKLLPYPISWTVTAESTKSLKNVESEIASFTHENLYVFHLFHQRMAKIQKSRVALAEERKLLNIEKFYLKKKIKENCMCFAFACPGPEKCITRMD